MSGRPGSASRGFQGMASPPFGKEKARRFRRANEKCGRDAEIRTRGLHGPIVARYRAALRPDTFSYRCVPQYSSASGCHVTMLPMAIEPSLYEYHSAWTEGATPFVGTRRDSSGWTVQYSEIRSELRHSFSFMTQPLYQIDRPVCELARRPSSPYLPRVGVPGMARIERRAPPPPQALPP